MALEERDHDLCQKSPSRHPLVVMPTTVEIGAVELSARKGQFKPSEDLFVAYMHPQGNLGLATVTPEVAFTDKEADDEALLELAQRWGTFHGKHDGETVP